MPDEQDAAAAERPAAVRAAPQRLAGVAGIEDPARLPVRALDRPRDDVLQPAERSGPLALGLGRPKPLVAADIDAAPAALQAAHGVRKPTRRAAGPTLSWRAMADPLRIVVLDGDQTGQELLEQALRVLDADVLGLPIDLPRYDLSLEHRRATGNDVVMEAARAMREAGHGLKAATITPEGRDDVGSPNRILREEVDGKVIIRTGRRIPGVTPIAGVHHPISVVRMAVDDAYGAKQWREGAAGAPDEVAYRTERITRATCRAVAEYAFRTAREIGGRVYGGPKWTVSPVYEGMLKEELDAAAVRHPE